jgi:hypothetical protein
VIHETRYANREVHNFDKSFVNLQPGRNLWLGLSPSLILVPINIIASIKMDHFIQKKEKIKKGHCDHVLEVSMK